MNLKIIASILMFYSVFSIAEPVSRDITIASFHPMSVDRSHCPSCSGITRIYVNNASWGSTDCRSDAADLFKEDEHILSLLMTAWIAGKAVKLEVNDQVKPIDTVCKITAAFIK
jgi:hypothetical protein